MEKPREYAGHKRTRSSTQSV